MVLMVSSLLSPRALPSETAIMFASSVKEERPFTPSTPSLPAIRAIPSKSLVAVLVSKERNSVLNSLIWIAVKPVVFRTSDIISDISERADIAFFIVEIKAYKDAVILINKVE